MRISGIVIKVENSKADTVFLGGIKADRRKSGELKAKWGTKS